MNEVNEQTMNMARLVARTRNSELAVMMLWAYLDLALEDGEEKDKLTQTMQTYIEANTSLGSDAFAVGDNPVFIRDEQSSGVILTPGGRH